MMHVRYWLVLLLVGMLTACGGEPPEAETGPVDSATFDPVARRQEVEHYNHWSPSVAGGMDQVIGQGNFYGNCANWSLWDVFASDGYASGFHTYATKSAVQTYDTGVYAPYRGADYGVCDGYGGANCTVAARVVMLINNKPYWNTPDLWSRFVGWNGSVYANTSSRSHQAGHCTGAFVLTFDADAAYARGEYWVSLWHDFKITNKDACISTHPDSVPWTALDLYVKECLTNNTGCRDRIGGYKSKVSGTWSGGVCDTASYIYYRPPAGYKPVYFNAVASAGLGHVPVSANINVERYY